MLTHERVTSSGDMFIKVEEVKVYDEYVKDITCLKLGLHSDNGGVKIYHNEAFPSWGMGEQFETLHYVGAIKKGIPPWGEHAAHHQDSVECARQRYDLDRFSIYQSQAVCWETGL
jgi:hypothetical protein